MTIGDSDHDNSSKHVLHTQENEKSEDQYFFEAKTTGKKYNPKMSKLLLTSIKPPNSAIDSKENFGTYAASKINH